MQQPKIFREERVDVMQDMMEKNPFACIVSIQNGEIIADHIPLTLHHDNGKLGTLRGHINTSNTMTKLVEKGSDVLVIFMGLHHYVSAAWYPSKLKSEKVVPTWNYITVHAKGIISFTQDSSWLLEHLTELTNRQEKTTQSSWKVSDAPVKFIEGQLKAITGIEIEISQLQGTWKLSQNKTHEDKNGVIDGLERQMSESAKKMSKAISQ